jgi:hypothetical protein
MSYYHFQVEWSVMNRDLLRRPSLDVVPTWESCERIRYECCYCDSNGYVVVQQTAQRAGFNFYLGIIPISVDTEDRIRAATLDYIRAQHDNANREEIREVPSSYAETFQSLGRSQRPVNPAPIVSFRLPGSEPTPRVDPGPEVSDRYASDYHAYEMSFTADYTPDAQRVIPDEVIQRHSRQIAEEFCNQQLGVPAPVESNEPRSSGYSRRDIERTRSFASLYGGNSGGIRQTSSELSAALAGNAQSQARSPRPTRSARRASRPKRRHFLTLVPYMNFEKCAKCFHDRDLKLMRVAALRTLKRLNEPDLDSNKAVQLWIGYEQALVHYGMAIATECRRRGFADASLEVFKAKYVPGLYNKPEWIKWARLRKSHQAILLLWEERRHVAKALIRWGHNRGARDRMLLQDVCSYCGVERRREWSHYRVGELRHSFNAGATVIPPYTSKYATVEGWTVTPDETYIYPNN